MKEMCPISFTQVNERAVQLNATLTVISLLFFLFTPLKWIILAMLTADFFIRGFLDPSYSPYSALSKAILRLFKVNPLMINAGPKIFAAKIGFLFCCVIALFSLLGFHGTSLVVGSIFIFFAALEALFRFCLACRIYPLIKR